MNFEGIWKIVKKIRVKSIEHLSLSSSTCGFGFEQKDFLIKVTEELEKMLQIKSSETVYTNVTDETLKNAAKVFLYLSFCPGKDLLSWKEFFLNMFKNQPKMILLNLNRILMNSNGFIQNSTVSIMDKLNAILKNQLVKGEG